MPTRRYARYSDPWSQTAEMPGMTDDTRQLPVNLDVEPDRVVITAHLPGFVGDQIDVSATGDTVIIRTTRGPGNATALQRLRHEVYTGNWYRRIDLPLLVRPDQATTTYENGVLTINLPKASPARKVTLNLPGAQTIGQKEIPMRSSADVMPPGPGPHESVFKP